VQDVEFSIPSSQQQIFSNYQNSNFSQKLIFKNNHITANITSTNPAEMELNYRVSLQPDHVERLPVPLKKFISHIYTSNLIVGEYFKNISQFLKDELRYSLDKTPQDTISVMATRRAHCIGYSNVVSDLLIAMGLKHRFVKGFYLELKNPGVYEPIPHRWLEIEMADGVKFFYDPQYQNFSANYILVKKSVNFQEILKFKVYLKKKSKKIIN
jgi:hypothetical protein